MGWQKMLIHSSPAGGVFGTAEKGLVGVGDMTKILYHDNNIYHDIVIFFTFKKGFYYIKIFDTISFS